MEIESQAIGEFTKQFEEFRSAQMEVNRDIHANIKEMKSDLRTLNEEVLKVYEIMKNRLGIFCEDTKEEISLPKAVESSSVESLHKSLYLVNSPVKRVVEWPHQLINGNGKSDACQVFDQMSSTSQPHESGQSSWVIPRAPQILLHPPDSPGFSRVGRVFIMNEQLRGTSSIRQPVLDSFGSILAYNDEVFGGIEFNSYNSDTEILLKSLEKANTSVMDVFTMIKAPWTTIYWQACSRTLWFSEETCQRLCQILTKITSKIKSKKYLKSWKFRFKTTAKRCKLEEDWFCFVDEIEKNFVNMLHVGLAHLKKRLTKEDVNSEEALSGEKTLNFTALILGMLLLKKDLAYREFLVRPLFKLLERFMSKDWVKSVFSVEEASFQPLQDVCETTPTSTSSIQPMVLLIMELIRLGSIVVIMNDILLTMLEKGYVITLNVLRLVVMYRVKTEVGTYLASNYLIQNNLQEVTMDNKLPQEKLRDACYQADLILVFLPHKRIHITEQVSELIRTISVRELMIEDLESCLEDANKKRYDKESMLKYLREATLVMKEAHKREYEENETHVFHLKSQSCTKTETISRLQEKLKMAKRLICEASNCATVSLVIINQNSEQQVQDVEVDCKVFKSKFLEEEKNASVMEQKLEVDKDTGISEMKEKLYKFRGGVSRLRQCMNMCQEHDKFNEADNSQDFPAYWSKGQKFGKNVIVSSCLEKTPNSSHTECMIFSNKVSSERGKVIIQLKLVILKEFQFEIARKIPFFKDQISKAEVILKEITDKDYDIDLDDIKRSYNELREYKLVLEKANLLEVSLWQEEKSIAPGHRDFIKNMITGTFQVAYAVLIIDLSFSTQHTQAYEVFHIQRPPED